LFVGVAAVNVEGLGDQAPDGEAGIKRRLRILEDDLDLSAV
jgi:hypothetical protein